MNEIIPINNCNIFLNIAGLIFIDKDIANWYQEEILQELKENSYIDFSAYYKERILSERFKLVKVRSGIGFIAFMIKRPDIGITVEEAEKALGKVMNNKEEED